MLKKAIAVILTVIMALSLMACGGDQKAEKKSNTTGSVEAKGTYDTLVIGTNELNGVFSPFFYNSGFDAQIIDMAMSSICVLNEKNELIPAMGEITAKEILGDDGNVAQTLYTVKLKEGLTFSDGKPVTIDDVIFNYYVYCDPMYDGMSTMNTMDIEGLKEYYYDTPDYSAKMANIEKEAQKVTEDEVTAYIESYTDADIEEYGAQYINDALGLGLDKSAKDFKDQVRNAYLEANKADRDTFISEAQAKKLKDLKAAYITGNLEDGIDVKDISGIKKVDDYTCTILINGVNITADRQLAIIPIAPKHYYGVAKDGTEFSKGDLSMVKAKNSTPLGSGAFIYESYDNNIVTLQANANYYKGAPKFPTLKFQVVDENNKVDATVLGDIDITDPSASKEVIELLKENDIDYSLVDNNGYGYINISAKRVPNINVRKGLMYLMNRKPAIESYYGELASIIERPMTTTLGEYPQEAKEYYGYNPKKAEECFKKAGYTKNSSGKLVDKDGKQLSIEVGIGDLASHPSAGILTQMKSDMDSFGAELVITDLDFNVLNDRVDNDDIDMWVMAWGNANDCNLSQMYHSQYTSKGGSNRTWLKDDKLDALLEKCMKTVDFEERKAIVAEELDIIMDWAVTMPVYQRKNLIIYNPKVVNVDTLPDTSTPYWTYVNQIETLELN